MNQELRIIALILAALLFGAAVLLFNPDYRIDTILRSNSSYYPAVTEATPTPTDTEFQVETDPADDYDDAVDLDLQKDFEF